VSARVAASAQSGAQSWSPVRTKVGLEASSEKKVLIRTVRDENRMARTEIELAGAFETLRLG
jgi:hypothetical protein